MPGPAQTSWEEIKQIIPGLEPHWDANALVILHFLTNHSRVGLCLLGQPDTVLQYNKGFTSLLCSQELPQPTTLTAWLTESSVQIWQQHLASRQSQTVFAPTPEWSSLRLTLRNRMNIQHDCICHVIPIAEHQYLLCLESAQQSTNALEVLEALNNQLSNLTRTLSQKNEELQRTNEIIERLMNIDPLTELANRRAINLELSHQYSLAKRKSLPLSVILCDLDHFKRVNDAHGHHYGDKVLVAFARLLERCCRHEDRIARWGGEEFLLVLPMTDALEAKVLAERICAQSRLLQLPLMRSPQTASLGIAELSTEDDTESILIRADQALYQAKDAGRDRYEIAPPPSTSGRS